MIAPPIPKTCAMTCLHPMSRKPPHQPGRWQDGRKQMLHRNARLLGQKSLSSQLCGRPSRLLCALDCAASRRREPQLPP